MKKILLQLIFCFLFSCTTKQGTFKSITANTLDVQEVSDPELLEFKAAHVVPTKEQYEYKKDEFTCFIHFGINSFTRKEWGDGFEEPKTFDLKNLDTDQWVRSMKDAGMTKVVFTAKHHDGFCLWQTRYTKHGIMSSPFQNGQGDILKDLSASCEKYGIKLGVYLSPADLYQIENPDGLYGNLSKYSERKIPREIEGRPFSNKKTFTFLVDDYNEYFLNQLFELLTEYGAIHEVWFDGAHPKRKGGQKYNYLAWKEVIRTLAPDAVIFGKEDIRWCGNEGGGTRATEWDIIPFEDDPNKMTRFPDLMKEDLGSVDQLKGANYLHYLPAETNTSIRSGWFYRDDVYQDVRSADDVFDMYERSVGGNSTFLLNIPPNREGKFSPRDVAVLKEVGNRIRSTYDNNLFNNAKTEKRCIDNDEFSFHYMEKGDELVIETKSPVTINRFMCQEAILSHSMRVKEHSFEVFKNGTWEELASGTVIGYKKILRFPTVTASKFRLKIKDTRAKAAISNIGGFFYKEGAPALAINRGGNDKVTIEKKVQGFDWKSEGSEANIINNDVTIYYTLDGTEPTNQSKVYTTPFYFEGGEVKAISYIGDAKSEVTFEKVGIPHKGWKIIGSSTSMKEHQPENIMDNNASSYWVSKENQTHFVAIDLGKEQSLSGFAYTPWNKLGTSLQNEGMIEKGQIQISNDGKKWKNYEQFEFGNLINDPTKRYHYFDQTLKARYIKIVKLRGAANSSTSVIAKLDFIK